MTLQAERLKGDLRLPSGGLAPAHLVLDDDGLWLRDHSNPTPEVRISVLDARPLAYLEGTFGDEVRVGEASYGVPAGRADAIKRLFARARLARPRAPSPPAGERFVEPQRPIEQRWLRGWLGEDEPLLAWLRLGRPTRVESRIGPDEDVEGAFVMTTRRVALVAVAALGDVKLRELSPVALEVGEGIRRPVLSGDVQLWASSSNGERFVEVAQLPTLGVAERAMAVARATRADELPDRRRAALFEAAAPDDPAAAVLTAIYAGAESAPSALEALLRADDPRAALFGLWDGWPLGPERGRRLVRWAVEAAVPSAAAAVLELHDHVHKARLGAASGGFAPAAIDLDFADHLIAQERWEAAESLLESRLRRLPSEELADLIPSAAPSGGAAEVEAGHGRQLMRIAILDRLADARGRGEGRHGPTVAELSRLMPLAPERVAELAAADAGLVAQRARAHREIVASRAWTEGAPRTARGELRALAPEEIEQVLRHPLSRKGHALGSLSGLLAEVDVPDEGALRAYCERLGAARADAHNALSDAMRVLSIPRCEAYVSRGDKSIGLRSYEGDDPFVLIGVAHLDEASPCHLGEAELRFALGAELAHLRYGHSRVTSTDIWVGALAKSKRGFDTVAGLLPAWRFLKVAQKASTLASYYQDGTVEWAFDKLGRLTGWRPFGETSTRDRRLSADPEDLVAAARVMQLTADRAGLLLCGDLHAAIRAMCLTQVGYAGVLAAADERSLEAVLAERDEDGEPRHQTLAIRVAALIAFYLSDDWDRLHEPRPEADGSLTG